MKSLPDEEQPRLLVVANLDRFLRNLKPHLLACREAGFRVEVACRVTDFADDVEQYCDRLHHVPMRRNPLHPENLLALEQLTAIVRAGGYDIVHSHTPVGGMIGRLAATFARVPIRIYMAHGFHFHPEGRSAGNLIFSRLEQIAGRRWCDIVEVINHDDYEAALRLKIARRENLFWLPGTGIDTTNFDPARIREADKAALRRELGLPENGPVLGVTAELIPRKRIEDAIQALALLSRAYPSANLIVLGSGPEQKRLESLAQSLGVAHLCHFTGFKREIPVYLSLMDIFLFPTKQEGLPLALMEAMSMGLPVVATDIRGNRDIVTDGKTGLLVPTERPQALSAACRRLLADRALARRLALCGQALVRSEFDTKLTVARQLAIYEQALRQAEKAGKFESGRPMLGVADTLRDMAKPARAAR